MSDSVQIGNLDHVGLSVADFDAQVKWYKEALGLHEVLSERVAIADPPLRIALLSGESGPCLELIERRGSQPNQSDSDDPVDRLLEQGYHHWAFTVTDIDASLARLQAAGAKPVGTKQDFTSHCVRLVCVLDPEGNMIELIQPLVAEGEDPPAGTWQRARHELATRTR
jgi:catechol 2,3-dioxygenase-like lactoylglutathione lyase family enzyme